jgi:hypothetical protein
VYFIQVLTFPLIGSGLTSATSPSKISEKTSVASSSVICFCSGSSFFFSAAFILPINSFFLLLIVFSLSLSANSFSQSALKISVIVLPFTVPVSVLSLDLDFQ